MSTNIRQPSPNKTTAPVNSHHRSAGLESHTERMEFLQTSDMTPSDTVADSFPMPRSSQKHLRLGDRMASAELHPRRKVNENLLQNSFVPQAFSNSSIVHKLASQHQPGGMSRSPVSETVSLTDGSQPDTPPSIGAAGPPFQLKDLKQQVEFLQSELHRYRQREVQERITQHTMDEIVGLASDADHLLINNGPKRSQTPQNYCHQMPLQSQSTVPAPLPFDGWQTDADESNSRVSSKGSSWMSQAQGFSTLQNQSAQYSNNSGYYTAGRLPPSPSPVFSHPVGHTQEPEIETTGQPAPGGNGANWPAPSSSSAFGYPQVTSSLKLEFLPSTVVPGTNTASQLLSQEVGLSTDSKQLPSFQPSQGYGPSGGQYHAGTSSSGMFSYTPSWNNRVSSSQAAPEFNQVSEPLNYRRMLEKDAFCNWDYVVDKIIMNNDQQASIFLQQKLKVGSGSQKHEIVDAILKRCFPLMINRFGNFLVQRCFEHGTPQQVVGIAQNIRGKAVLLSMDPFGCHVVQKALDCVPEEYKACFVHELLRQVPDTVVHRYACHVWQKLFELRWDDSPPQIMKYVNEYLSGSWHEVALSEMGSLVVQNIFENCVEEDKRPCIDEVLENIDIIARGQFGNWCIQHICENGLPADKARAIDHVIHYATEYSVDQYASKVIEKCLKVGGPEFFEKYLNRVCEARIDRPRMPLIDIAGDQFGNYLIQFILASATLQHRELVASHVRKHMVSLRGSKYGSRVAMLCSNPSTVTRPGPPGGSYSGRYNGRNFRNHHYS